MSSKYSLLFSCLVLSSGPVSAHVGDRVIPIPEIPDDFLEEIDIHDGSVQEWVDLFGEPTLTPFDLTPSTCPGCGPYDPSDLDFRVWIGWHGVSGRIYVVVESIDDVFVPGFSSDGWIAFCADGDHSGGVHDLDEPFFSRESMWTESQSWVAAVFLEDSPQPIFMTAPEQGWYSGVPKADAGGVVLGENPSVWLVEMYMTPFDLLVLDSQDHSVASQLLPGRIFGFLLSVVDADTRSGVADSYYLIPSVEGANLGPDLFADALLVGAVAPSTDDSVIGADSWARIKASFGVGSP